MVFKIIALSLLAVAMLPIKVWGIKVTEDEQLSKLLTTYDITSLTQSNVSNAIQWDSDTDKYKYADPMRRENVHVARDENWGRWGSANLYMAWTAPSLQVNWNSGLRNRVADAGAKKAWDAWTQWTSYNLHAQYAGGLRRRQEDVVTIEVPGHINADMSITKSHNKILTYTLNSTDGSLTVATIRNVIAVNDELTEEDKGIFKRQRTGLSQNMAFTKVGGPGCYGSYDDIYGAAYHTSYVSTGSNLQMCGYINVCCNNGCEAMQMQVSIYPQNEWNLWGNCLNINRNAPWSSYTWY
jgi:hypothetical protein